MENINKALAQLEESLQKIDSARIQVEKVTESGSELSKSTIKLAQEVKSIADVIKAETILIINKFSERLDSVDTGIKSEIDDFSKKLIEFQDFSIKSIKEIDLISSAAIKSREDEITKGVSTVIQSINSKTTLELEKISKSFDNFDKSLNAIKDKNVSIITIEAERLSKLVSKIESTSVNSIAAIKEQALLEIKEQNSANLKAIETILKSSNQIKELIVKITEMELAIKLQLVDEKLKVLNNTVLSIQNQINENQLNIVNKLQSDYVDLNMKLTQNTKSINSNKIISILTLIAVLSLIVLSFLK